MSNANYSFWFQDACKSEFMLSNILAKLKTPHY